MLYTCPEPSYEFDKASLLEYNHMNFGGPPVTVETVEEADELLRNDEKESAIGNLVKVLFCVVFVFELCYLFFFLATKKIAFECKFTELIVVNGILSCLLDGNNSF